MTTQFGFLSPQTFDIPCQSSRETHDHTTHEITISPDWTVSTPHDLEAERVAAAFGGWISCLELESAVKAVRMGMALHLRRRWYPLHHVGPANWTIYRKRGGHTKRFASAITAAAYARSADHLSEMHGAPAWQIHRLIELFRCRFTGYVAPTAGADRHDLVLEPHGLDRLWDAGIHPESLPHIRRWVGEPDRPLSVAAYIEIAYSRISPHQYRAMVAVAGDLDTVITHIGAGVRTSDELVRRLNQQKGEDR
ncbi:hypothetical protein [Mycolicibacterium fortuitum]|uniref:hypothetical protein n=1 Tax=Mycolicibacterium fortuitum TaxID=1766 RepID=UPI001CDD5DF1|nr:hypothetical protein [Mycolicibacterium fortuitum]UBV13918.1 hypothetical protein H8Z57_24440 [Mycolicibacterium fortuitum]